MHRDSAGLQQRGLLIRQRIGHEEGLALVNQHLVAPAAADGLRAGQIAILTEAVVAGGAMAAGWLEVPGGAALVGRVGGAVAAAQDLHPRTRSQRLAPDPE